MQVTYQTESLDKSRISLKIKVDKVEVDKEYGLILAEAQKNAVIKGFRKGKVPVSILEMKFKEDFLKDAAGKLIDESFKSIVDKLEDKPLTYAMPKMDKFTSPVKGEDYSFELIYETYPKIKFGNYKGVDIEQNIVTIDDTEVMKDIDRSLEEFASIEVKSGKISDGDIVQVRYEVRDGDRVEKKSDVEYIHIGKDYDSYRIGSDLIGLKKDDKKNFDKDYSGSEIESLKGKKLSISVEVLEVKTNKKPDLTDELAKQIDKDCNTVDELKVKVKKDLEEYTTNFLKNETVNSIMDKVTATFEGDIPESMIDEQINLYYNDLLGRVGGNKTRVEQLLKLEGLNMDSYKVKMRDKAIEEIKRALILRDVAKIEKITVSDEEVKKHIEPFTKYYKMEVDEFMKLVEANGQIDVFKNEVEVKKAIDFIYDNAKIKKGKKIKLDELNSAAK